MTKTCKHCGGTFEAKTRAKYCSDECRIVVTKAEQSAWKKNNVVLNRKHGRKSNAKQRAKKGYEDIQRTHMLKKYGITVADYNAMYEAQNGVCLLCGEVCPTGRRLAVDHDHATGKVRGLLCLNCNQMLGKAKDNPDLLRKAIDYLEVGVSHGEQ